MAAEANAGVRHVRTPEGVTLPFEIGGAGDRLAALAIDLAIVVGVSFALWLVGVVASLAAPSRGAGAAFLLLAFVIRTFYFTLAELRWSGTTIGKRRFGLRVISRDGGPLTPDAVFARNLTREIEIFLPLVALFQPRMLLPGLPVWGALAGLVWIAGFALLPLLNRERLRVGDVLAGTIVIRMPAARLLDDVAEMADIRAPTGASPAERYRFSPEQLELYGIRELHVLERVLRDGADPAQQDVLDAVASAIRTKIGWPDDRVDTWAFLTSFYKAQRARLEQRMLFGDRRESKDDGPASS